jgi:hypothetical protein
VIQLSYENIIEELEQCISNITLSKLEEKDKYKPVFESLYGNTENRGNIPEEPFYLNKWNETIKWLSLERNKYTTNQEFYFEVAKKFASNYIPLMIEEYKITDEKLIFQLLNIANGTNIRIFNKGEAQQYAASFNEEINGDVGAFKFHDLICFTPDYKSKGIIVSPEESVQNATHMLASMIHETMHLLINTLKYEYFIYNGKSKLTSGGSSLNEGLVEMHSLDFAKKYNLIHLPNLYYLNDVVMCKLIKEMLGTEEFERISFSGKYDEMLPDNLLINYQTNERIRYFSRKGYDVDPAKIVIQNEENIKTI